MPKVVPQEAGPRESIRDEALRLHDAGFWVVPCRGKVAVWKAWQTQRRRRADLEAVLANGHGYNIGIVLSQSNLIDVECDSDDAETAVQSLFGGKVPPTPTWKSKRGRHRLFKRPEGLPEKPKVDVDGIEFRIG